MVLHGIQTDAGIRWFMEFWLSDSFTSQKKHYYLGVVSILEIESQEFLMR